MKFRLVRFIAVLVVGMVGASLVYARDAPQPTVTGVVKTQQAAVSGALVLFKQGSETKRAVTDEAGAFVSPPLAPGECQVIVRADGYGHQSRTISLPDSGRLEFVLSSPTASGEEADPGVALAKTVDWNVGGGLGVARFGIGKIGVTVPTVQLDLSRTVTHRFQSGGGSLFSISNRYETSRNNSISLPTSTRR